MESCARKEKNAARHCHRRLGEAREEDRRDILPLLEARTGVPNGRVARVAKLQATLKQSARQFFSFIGSLMAVIPLKLKSKFSQHFKTCIFDSKPTSVDALKLLSLRRGTPQRYLAFELPARTGVAAVAVNPGAVMSDIWRWMKWTGCFAWPPHVR